MKQSSNARIQALYHRKADLKTHYRRIVQIQKNALEMIAEKSLDRFKEEPSCYTKEPEYEEVNAGLKCALRKIEGINQHKLNLKRLELKKILNGNQAYEMQQFSVSRSRSCH